MSVIPDQPTLQEVNSLCNGTTVHLISDLSKILNWYRANLVSKALFLILSAQHNLPVNYTLFSSDTQLSPLSTLNILSLPFISNLKWKLSISSLVKAASVKLGVLELLPPIFLTHPPTGNSAQGSYLFRFGVCFTCMEGVPHVLMGESKAFRLMNSSPLTNCLQLLSHHCNVAFLAIFCYFHIT